MYLAGTQDPEAALRYQRQGENDPAALFVPYVRQFLDLCDDTRADGIVISLRPPRRRLQLDRFTFYNVPNPLRTTHGRRYELGQIIYGLLVGWLCLVNRPDVVFVGDGMMHYSTIPILRISGARIVLSFHNTLWTHHSDQPDRWKEIARSNRRIFTRTISAAMCASDAIADDFREVTDGQCAPLLEFLPTFTDAAFQRFGQAPPDAAFSILYVGRILASKGVFDVLRVTEILCERGATDLKVVMCGDGPASDRLIEAIGARGLSAVITYEGQQAAAAMAERYSSAHLVIVPTRTEFREGFNHVVAEGVLAGRPVVTSTVCPAAHYFKSIIRLAVPDSPESYADLVWQEYLRRTDFSCQQFDGERAARFRSADTGWRGAATRALKLVADERKGFRLGRPTAHGPVRGRVD
jgi:glycosyltransferase involved in cell wall biosynthesis